MALLNPFQALVIPFLCIVTFPLAIFASLTTTIAFSVLLFRVFLVYIDLAISLLPKSLPLFGLKHSAPSPSLAYTSLYESPQTPSSLTVAPPTMSAVTSKTTATTAASIRPSTSHPTLVLARRRRRRPSSASTVSGGTITPGAETNLNSTLSSGIHAHPHSHSLSSTHLGLMPSVGAERDFEGIGGWRSGQDDDDAWTTINAKSNEWTHSHHYHHHYYQHHRHHSRSASGGGPTTPGEGGYLMMKSRTKSPASPNNARTRTPSGPRISLGDSYFPLTTSRQKRDEAHD